MAAALLVVVVGATVLILIALAHQSIRSPRTTTRAEHDGATADPGKAGG